MGFTAGVGSRRGHEEEGGCNSRGCEVGAELKRKNGCMRQYTVIMTLHSRRTSSADEYVWQAGSSYM